MCRQWGSLAVTRMLGPVEMSKPQADGWGFLRLYMFSASYDAVAWQTPSPLPAEQRVHIFRHLMLGGLQPPNARYLHRQGAR